MLADGQLQHPRMDFKDCLPNDVLKDACVKTRLTSNLSGSSMGCQEQLPMSPFAAALPMASTAFLIIIATCPNTWSNRFT